MQKVQLRLINTMKRSKTAMKQCYQILIAPSRATQLVSFKIIIVANLFKFLSLLEVGSRRQVHSNLIQLPILIFILVPRV